MAAEPTIGDHRRERGQRTGQPGSRGADRQGGTRVAIEVVGVAEANGKDGAWGGKWDEDKEPNRADLEDLVIRLRVQADDLEAMIASAFPQPPPPR